MTTLYSIKDWDALYENHDSRKLKRLNWVLIPNKHDGKSYRRIIQMKDGVEIFAAWILILQVASKCQERGILADKDGPLTPEDLALKTGVKESLFKKALSALSDNNIGWMSATDLPASPGNLPESPDVARQKGREGKGIEEGVCCAREENPVVPNFDLQLGQPYQDALALWGRLREEGGLKTFKDLKTRAGALTAAAMIENQEATLADIEIAIQNVLANESTRTKWSFEAVMKNFSMSYDGEFPDDRSKNAKAGYGERNDGEHLKASLKQFEGL